MKKFGQFTLNLKFLRIPILLCLFLSLILFSTSISQSIPPIRIGRSFRALLLSSGTAIKTPFLIFIPGIWGRATSGKETATVHSEIAPVPPAPPAKTLSSEVKLSNSTSHKIDIRNYLGEAPPFLKGNLSVLIVHTHTTESYTPSEKYNYTPTDTDRTLDKKYNMVRIGEEVSAILRKRGIKVYHDTTINDYPSYNGSYNRSSMRVSDFISGEPSIRIVLDIHRDAIEGAGGEKITHNFTFDGKRAASVMLVAGSNLSGLEHKNWKENLRFAATLQKHAEEMHPGMMRPINFRSQRFNQHLAPGAIIVEIGTNGNTLEEALLGAGCFADALADYIIKYSN